MTDTMEHVRAVVDAVSLPLAPQVRPGRNPRDPAGDCTNDRHGASRNAWGLGCRCPKAIAAHRAFSVARLTHMPAQVGADGTCTAVRHGSNAAYETAGCRCPEAVDRHRQCLDRENARQAGRRVPIGPPGRWRGPDMRVSRTNLMLLLSGFVDSPTSAERQAAVAILSERGGRTGMYTSAEIGARIGVTSSGVQQIRLRMRNLAAMRAERRLADVKWKAVRVARAQAKGAGQ